MSELENPFQETLIQRHRAEPCTVVIFGATGDLTHRKLIPALYNLAAGGDLPPQAKVVGFARRDKTDEGFRAELEEANKKHSRQGHDPALWASFGASIHYHKSEFQDLEGYKSLKALLDKFDEERGVPANRLFYLASAPEFFDEIMLMLKQSGLNEGPEGKWARVVCEKPFGKDLKTARHLNQVVNDVFAEKDTYRIDHYLGKETAQNIMVLRFANVMFEPLWNSTYIDHVQITCAENLGMEGGRGGYYDTAGALRDMVQNHLFQLLSLVAMEPPSDLGADAVRDEKVKVIRSLRRYKGPEEVAKNIVRAQYTAGSVDGVERVGYRQEDRVNPESKTESYVALRLFVDTWRWQGVPFYMRVGKQLPKKATEISIHFKAPPQVPFPTLQQRGTRNVLVIRIQPDEGISLRMLSKLPGVQLLMQPVKMDFRYSTSFGKASPEAYERLLLDAMAGDATLFARRDEVENAWAFIDELENAWHKSGNPPPMCEYPAGSWGPKEADELLQADGRVWRRL
ncbi:glucose-6-phosphate 1-dehydrogenase [Roseimicrobium gellanilyticum]|uniref:Glucose-6-phosphate 1-dehydrogenase n=1 Tax=Roseimicrobium gellanilyticum TaxID=748857 RepID=A0A366HHD2_9BACT|nr:glucose-6-phosphate dehydrogenase [Roseimicrobium gellanilyticum]RBP41336.1 glucose-6-phosphate 1-dehydrogenase [Roseimicrobium gellanilyticum]